MMKIIKGYGGGFKIFGFTQLGCTYCKKIGHGETKYLIECFSGRLKLFQYSFKNKPIIRNLYLLNLFSLPILIFAYLKAVFLIIKFFIYGWLIESFDDGSPSFILTLFWELLAIGLIIYLLMF